MFFDRDVGVFTWCTGTWYIVRTIVPYLSVLYCTVAQSCRRVVSWWLIIGEGNFEMEKPMRNQPIHHPRHPIMQNSHGTIGLDWILEDSCKTPLISNSFNFTFPAILHNKHAKSVFFQCSKRQTYYKYQTMYTLVPYASYYFCIIHIYLLSIFNMAQGSISINVFLEIALLFQNQQEGVMNVWFIIIGLRIGIGIRFIFIFIL